MNRGSDLEEKHQRFAGVAWYFSTNKPVMQYHDNEEGRLWEIVPRDARDVWIREPVDVLHFNDHRTHPLGRPKPSARNLL